jgi:hypothetical protein
MAVAHGREPRERATGISQSALHRTDEPLRRAQARWAAAELDRWGTWMSHLNVLSRPSDGAPPVLAAGHAASSRWRHAARLSETHEPRPLLPLRDRAPEGPRGPPQGRVPTAATRRPSPPVSVASHGRASVRSDPTAELMTRRPVWPRLRRLMRSERAADQTDGMRPAAWSRAGAAPSRPPSNTGPPMAPVASAVDWRP